MIVLRNVTAYVGKLGSRVKVLNQLSASFEPKKSYVVFGARGAGKSTLIRLIAGTQRPAGGRVIRNAVVAPPLTSAVLLAPYKTGKELVFFLAHLYDVPPQELYRFVLGFSKIKESLLAKPIAGMSPQLRGAFSVSLVYGLPADFYLSDGVPIFGEGSFRESCVAAFEARRRQSATITVLNNTRGAERYGDAGGVLHGGRLVQYASLADAVQSFHELQAAGGENLSSILALARSGQTKVARDILLSLNQEEQLSPPGQVELASLLLQLGDVEAAEQVALQVVEDDPLSAQANFILARIAESRGQFEEAVERAKLSLQAEPGQQQCRVLLARCYDRLGRFTEAGPIWKDEASSSGNSAVRHLALRSFIQSGDWPQVLALTESSGQISAQHLELRFKAFSNLKRWTEAGEVISALSGNDLHRTLGLILNAIRDNPASTVSGLIGRVRWPEKLSEKEEATLHVLRQNLGRHALAAERSGKEAEASEFRQAIQLLQPPIIAGAMQ